MEIVVESDYDGYFESLVRGWVQRKENPKHKKIIITAGPYRCSAVTLKTEGDTLRIDFYSALRAGFGLLTDSDIDSIIEEWL